MRATGGAVRRLASARTRRAATTASSGTRALSTREQRAASLGADDNSVDHDDRRQPSAVDGSLVAAIRRTNVLRDREVVARTAAEPPPRDGAAAGRGGGGAPSASAAPLLDELSAVGAARALGGAEPSHGRHCPIRYRYGARALSTRALPPAAERDARVMYVVGGLYGNAQVTSA